MLSILVLVTVDCATTLFAKAQPRLWEGSRFSQTICIVVWKMVKTAQCAGFYCEILGLRNKLETPFGVAIGATIIFTK